MASILNKIVTDTNEVRYNTGLYNYKVTYIINDYGEVKTITNDNSMLYDDTIQAFNKAITFITSHGYILQSVKIIKVC